MSAHFPRSLALLINAGLCVLVGLFMVLGVAGADGGLGICHVVQTPTFTHYWGTVTAAGQQAPAGAVVEALSPRGDVVGCFAIGEPGVYGLMRVYGEDAGSHPPLPGMREGEAVSFRVDGLPAEPAVAPVAWSGDRDVHQVSLSSAGMMSALYLPLIRSPHPFGALLP